MHSSTNEKKIEGDYWFGECSARGWPLPKLDWYFNGNLITNKNKASNQDKQSSQILKHHTNQNITVYLFIYNLTLNKSGIYSCILNENIFIKNVSISVIENVKNNSVHVKTTSVSRKLIFIIHLV